MGWSKLVALSQDKVYQGRMDSHDFNLSTRNLPGWPIVAGLSSRKISIERGWIEREISLSDLLMPSPRGGRDKSVSWQ